MECPTERSKFVIYRFFLKLLPAPCARFHVAAYSNCLALKNDKPPLDILSVLVCPVQKMFSAIHLRPA